MAYSAAWDETSPAGSALRSTMDDAVRALKRDIRERMNTIVNDWTTDPVVPKASLSGGVTGKKMLVPFAAWTDVGGYVDGVWDVASAQPAGFAPLVLPNGVTITRVRWLMANGDANIVTCQLKNANFSTSPSPAVLNQLTTTASGIQILDTGAGGVSLLVDSSKYYYLSADKGTGTNFQIYAVEITYDTPDGRNTI